MSLVGFVPSIGFFPTAENALQRTIGYYNRHLVVVSGKVPADPIVEAVGEDLSA
jgi:hypothetical protein